jgi:Zn-dependent protease
LTADTLVLGVTWYAAFLLSLTGHEAAHALAAKWGGDPTAYHGGQVSLDPLPHMRREWLGMLVIPLITFAGSGFMIGWASAPYDPDWQRRYPRRAAWMALAGPAANFTLVLLAAAAIRIGLAAGVFIAPRWAGFAQLVVAGTPPAAAPGAFLSILFSLNLLLGAFNLLPIPPLDGATGVGVLLGGRAALRFAELSRNPTFALLGILVAWQVFGRISDPVFRTGLALLYP